jgi:hypothetical protein
MNNIYLQFAHMGSSTPIELDDNKFEYTGKTYQDFFGRRMVEIKLKEKMFFRNMNNHDLYTDYAMIIN